MSVSNATTTHRRFGGSALPTIVLIATVLVMMTSVVMLSLGWQQWVIAVFLIAIIFLIRNNAATAGMLVALEVMIGWAVVVGSPVTTMEFWRFVGPMCAVILLVQVFLTQSREHPWRRTPHLWVWGAFLAVGLIAGLRALTLSDSMLYYMEMFIVPAVIYLLSRQVIFETRHLWTLLQVIAAFGALIGLHSLIITAFGVFLFETPLIASYLYGVSNFTLFNSTIERAGSFLLNPDWNGAFLATMVLLPVGLAWAAKSWRARMLYIGEAVLVLSGLVCTFSLGSLFALAPSALLFVLMVSRTMKQRLITLGSLVLGAAGVLIAKPSLLNTFMAHLSAPNEVSLRTGAWETALRVTLAHPLTGIGLGYPSYLARADPYRVATQYKPLAQPHDVYLELGAMGGFPVLLLFLALLALVAYHGYRLWLRSDSTLRVLAAAMLCSLLTLTLNSITINAWTIAPLATLGWLLAGSLVSLDVARSGAHSPSLAETSEKVSDHGS